MKILHLIQEAPVHDITTVGDWDKNSSIRDPRDRRLIKNPAVRAKLKNVFSRFDENINFIFVNTPKGNKFTEEGRIDSLEKLREMLGDEVHDEAKRALDEDPDVINMIFTNNKGAERVPLTPWIICHRMAHAFGRQHNLGRPYGNGYGELKSAINEFVSRSINELYNYEINLKPSYGYNEQHYKNRRQSQLLFKNLMTQVCTFKSARDKKIREYFEVYNELFAQNIITGKNTHNPYPPVIKVGNSKRLFLTRDKIAIDQMEQYKSMVFNDLSYYVDAIFSENAGSIYLM